MLCKYFRVMIGWKKLQGLGQFYRKFLSSLSEG